MEVAELGSSVDGHKSSIDIDICLQLWTIFV
jgi:hypothetical protein